MRVRRRLSAITPTRYRGFLPGAAQRSDAARRTRRRGASAAGPEDAFQPCPGRQHVPELLPGSAASNAGPVRLARLRGTLPHAGAGAPVPGRATVQSKGEFSAFSKRFARYREACGVTGIGKTQKDFHSLRHSFQHVLYGLGWRNMSSRTSRGTAMRAKARGSKPMPRGPTSRPCTRPSASFAMISTSATSSGMASLRFS